MINEVLYEESLHSKVTSGLFIALTLLFLVLFSFLLLINALNILILICFCLFLFFLFYTLNYHTLTICITPHAVKLTFGIFNRATNMDNIVDCHIDEVSTWRIGGAGVHFTRMQGKWRAMFNFLEYQRIVLTLNKGRIREIVFSTQRPEEVLRIIEQKFRK